MGKDAIIFCLLLVIISLLAIIFYLTVMAEPKPDPCPEPLPEFPAEEILQSIQNDFDQLSLKWERRKEQPDGMNPQEKTLPYIPPKPKPDRMNPQEKKRERFVFRPPSRGSLKADTRKRRQGNDMEL